MDLDDKFDRFSIVVSDTRQKIKGTMTRQIRNCCKNPEHKENCKMK